VRRSRCEGSGSETPGHSLEDLTSGRTPAGQWNAPRTETLKRRPKHHVEANEGLAASNARKLFSEKHATYAHFIAFVRYPEGLRTFFRRSSHLDHFHCPFDIWPCGATLSRTSESSASIRRESASCSGSSISKAS
jgi:hypothetical protein